MTTAERAKEEQLKVKQAAATLEQSAQGQRQLGLPKLAGNRATTQLLAAEGTQSPRNVWMRGRIVFLLRQGPAGFGVERWEVEATQPSDGLTVAERAALDQVITTAVVESQRSEMWARVFTGTIETKVVPVTLSMSLLDLRDERSRSLLASRIGDHMRGEIQSTRNVEAERRRQRAGKLRFEPRPGMTVEQELAREKAHLREEIDRMRREMSKGRAEQLAAQSMLGEFSAFIAISPAPDLDGWNSPEWYLKKAEESLDYDDPRAGDMFMDVARVSLEGQQKWWARYKHNYDFGIEVLSPVFWRAASLFSLGIVDRKLFETASKASAQGTGFADSLGYTLLEVGKLVSERVGNLLSLGFYEGWKSGVETHITANPNDPLWQALLEATPDGIEAIVDSMLPIAEFQTMAGQPVADEHGNAVAPDFWMKLEAFFSAVLKVIDLAERAGAGKGGKGGKGRHVEETGAAKKKVVEPKIHPKTGLPESGLDVETGSSTERQGTPEGYGLRDIESAPDVGPTPESQRALDALREGEHKASDFPETAGVDPKAQRETSTREIDPADIPSTQPGAEIVAPKPTGAREIDLENVQKPTVKKKDALKETAPRELKKSELKETTGKKRGKPSEELTGTGLRKGMSFHEYNAAEIVKGVVLRYDAVSGRLLWVEFRIDPPDPSATKVSRESVSEFLKDPTIEGPQMQRKATSGTDYQRGHTASIDDMLTSPESAEDVSTMPHIVPMHKVLNNSGWKISENEARAIAAKTGQPVKVRVDVDWGAQPKTLKDGTPIPKAFSRTTTTMDGKPVDTKTPPGAKKIKKGVMRLENK